MAKEKTLSHKINELRRLRGIIRASREVHFLLHKLEFRLPVDHNHLNLTMPTTLGDNGTASCGN
jgi:hypothetical protein